ncbi:ABC transporter B family member 26, chloroplastic-like [Zingiber officinale]|uniref:ABC transporter B family member 26, chloroplastic-like n=1 Tax=Zingiber officinale TaxID=94328 RepID=UPI001C4DD35A|nr:ABC transporter B family member 26, chloroplastic-like [Zingiber officinale]
MASAAIPVPAISAVYPPARLHFRTKLLPSSFPRRLRRRLAPPLRAAAAAASSSSSSSSSSLSLGAVPGHEVEEFDVTSSGSNVGLLDRVRSGIAILRDVLPGGSWWDLEQIEWGKGSAEVWNSGKKGLSVSAALRRMWMLVANDRLVIFVAFACLAFAALSEISIPHFLTASIFSAQSQQTMMFYRNARLLVLLCLISGICSGLRGCCFGIANMILVRRMREMLYDAILFQDISFLDKETVGDLTSRLGSDCQQVSRVIGNDLNLILRNALQATGALIYLFILSWRLTLSTLAICSALSTIMFFYGQYQKQAAKLTQELVASANEVAQETLSLFRTVRVYGTEKQEFGRYMNWLKSLSEVSLRQSVAYGFWSSSFNFLYHSTQIIAVLVGGISILSGQISAEQLTKFILYSEWLIYSTWWVGDNWSSLMQSIGASEKVFELMDLLPSKQFLAEGVKLQKLEGRIDFVDVSFNYPSRSTATVLRKLNLSVHPNEVIAIVGLSGSGKSTLVNLLLGLYEPTSGQILVDGVPLTDLSIKWLRKNIGYVGQEPRLFRMDVSSNIRYGCPRDVSHEEVERAAKQAYAHEFISSLPNGYETLVDDALLSGGQKQRIAIARAILRDPKILILDEATSALDAESEFYVKEVLHLVQNRSSVKRTVLVIAHRLSTIQAADKIIVMDSGSIVEMGNHKELIEKDGLYAQLVKRQANPFAC